MKTQLKTLAVACLAALAFASCTKEVKEPETQDEVSEETLNKIKLQGFRTDNVQRVDGGYLVEGDILLSEESLNAKTNSPTLRVGQEEQYRTTNLVSGTRTIRVSVSGSVSSTFIAAVDGAIGRYNAEGLRLTFQRVSSGGDINIRLVNTNQYIASAGFPTSSGNPYGTINYAKRYSTYSLNFMTTVIAHEIGHCIGFRHTDYMNRSYSCGGSYYNEGASSVGAIHIPGTPTGPDPNSWMLACLSSTTNRPFNSNDRTALDYLYGK